MSLASTEPKNASPENSDHKSQNKEYLSFLINGELYGVDILRVQEIKGWSHITEVPNTPKYILGVMNLRGTIVPIIDMRRRFNLEEIENFATTVVVVLTVESKNDQRNIGIVVDGVSDVLNVSPDNFKATPDFGAAVNTEFLTGLATVDEEMVMLLNIDKLLNSSELEEIKQIEA